MVSKNKLHLGFLICLLAPVLRLAIADVHHHEFVVQEAQVERLCQTSRIVTVNGQFPGPTLEVRNGDSLVIKVVNRVVHNATIHWHGVRQMRNGWADGTAYVTQCPIKHGASYTYRFDVEGQEGTLWWHAHSPWLRATVYGAIVVRPRKNSPYPLRGPDAEALVILGEWWIKDIVEMSEEDLGIGKAPRFSDALLINGQPGDLYNCSSKETTVIPVVSGQTVLRFINAGLESRLFVAIAGHPMTVVGIDASYTEPFTTSYLMLGPGQTTDVLIRTNQPSGCYYIATRAFDSGFPLVPYDNSTATAILNYDLNSCNSGTGDGALRLPPLPAYKDLAAAAAFAAGLKSPGEVDVPGHVDEHLFITLALGFLNCPPGKICGGPAGKETSASMNNISFMLPEAKSLLQAVYFAQSPDFTTDFPTLPPVTFNFTNNNADVEFANPMRATKILKVKYGSVVQMVLQGTSVLSVEEHPMHLHGYSFYVLAAGSGNYDEERDAAKFNLVNPPRRSTVGVPAGGWVVIRFRADNPGVWLLHCHVELHQEWGMMTAILVENGAGEMESIPRPPPDLPPC